MIYLTLMVSEVPIIPHLSVNQKVHVWAQTMVPDQFDTLEKEAVQEYVNSTAGVIAEDLGVPLTSTPLPASEPETPSS